MVVWATVRDSDYTNIIKNYFDKFKFCNYKAHLRELGVDEYFIKAPRADELLISAVYNKPLSYKEKEEFKSIVNESILYFVERNYPSDLAYFQKHLHIELSDHIVDVDNNGEVVFLMLTADKIIVM